MVASGAQFMEKCPPIVSGRIRGQEGIPERHRRGKERMAQVYGEVAKMGGIASRQILPGVSPAQPNTVSRVAPARVEVPLEQKRSGSSALPSPPFMARHSRRQRMKDLPLAAEIERLRAENNELKARHSAKLWEWAIRKSLQIGDGIERSRQVEVKDEQLDDLRRIYLELLSRLDDDDPESLVICAAMSRTYEAFFRGVYKAKSMNRIAPQTGEGEG